VQTEETEESLSDDTPDSNAQRWTLEFKAAREALEDWLKLSSEIDDRYLNKKDGLASEKRLPLFTSNLQLQHALMFGKTPQVSVERRYCDPRDDIARVASEIQERLINADFERKSDTAEEAFDNALRDNLANDYGCVWLRYDVGETSKTPGKPAVTGPDGKVLAEAVPEVELRPDERVHVDYVHWRDVLWSAGARVWSDVLWVARRVQMSRRGLVKRFGKVGNRVPLNSKRGPQKEPGQKRELPWARADVWEIWEKDSKKKFWFVEGFDETLDEQDDKLGLDGFFPCPKFFTSNASTSALVPRPDYALTRDQYEALDVLETRIGLLEDAIRVVGLYDKTNKEVGQLLSNTSQNVMIPVENWALLAEKGGLRGVVDWFPLDQVVGALTQLRDVRREKIDLLYQLNGMADIMRGQATQAGATATEQRAKVQFGSARMQKRQDQFARFVSDALRIKGEIIAKHFSPKTILERCNCQLTPDAKFAPQAIEMLKSQNWRFRIEVKPESVALTDFAALKDERTEVVAATATYWSGVAPLIQQLGPSSMSLFLEVYQWMLSGLRGAKQIEGVVDQYIAQAKQMAAQPQQPQRPDPKLIAQQMKGQQDMAKIQAELKADAVRAQIDVQTEQAKQRAQTDENTRELVIRNQINNAMKPPEPPHGVGGGPAR
jgi:hypothetical protein